MNSFVNVFGPSGVSKRSLISFTACFISDTHTLLYDANSSSTYLKRSINGQLYIISGRSWECDGLNVQITDLPVCLCGIFGGKWQPIIRFEKHVWITKKW